MSRELLKNTRCCGGR